MEELVEYLRKTFDEPTLKIINFIQRTNLLTSEMKIDVVKEGENTVNKPSPNIVETSYLRLCDEFPEFNHNMMGEIFLHYMEYVLRDLRANWRFDLNRLNIDLANKCSYCNIKLKHCPMKVLGYIKKCIRDEKLNEQAFFENLMKVPKAFPENNKQEEEIAEKVLSLCQSAIDIKGAEFLLDTDSIKIEKEEESKIYYKILDFEVKNISFINNLYSFFVDNEGISKEFDISDIKINGEYSYMFDKSPEELAVYIKYLCDKSSVNYYRVFSKIYKKIGRFENVAKLAYYNEYLNRIDRTLDCSKPLQDELKEVLTYIKNYDRKIKLPYMKFDFLIYTKNTRVIDNTIAILNKYCRTYNYLSNKNIIYVDTEMFIKRTKDNFDVIGQLDRLYNENDFIVFTNVDKATNINEYRFNTFLTTIPKFYNRNMRSITIFTGEKLGLEKILEGQDKLKNDVFKHVIDVEALSAEDIKRSVFEKLTRVGKISDDVKSKIEEYIDNQYRKGTVNEEHFISNICNDIIYNKFKKLEENDNIENASVLESKQEVSQKECLEKLEKLSGLYEVKFRVKEIMKYLEYQKKIGEEKNINVNMVFKGNSGTGKTTVSRIMAELLYSLGIINSNKIIEVTGKDLIGEHLGQTAPKTQRIIDSALDGVLVIDEAQTIMTSKGSADYPAEAIATLCNNMDKYKDRLVVIFAGYKKEMNNFENKNVGLASRIGFEIEFEDFTVDELLEIFENKLKEKGFEIEEKAIDKIKKHLQKAKIMRNFGNARYVENLFEKLILAHSMNWTDENLKKISLIDVDDMEKTIKGEDKSIDDILSELNSLIGLKDVKDVIDGFVSVLEFNRKLNRQNDFNMHMIFKGNAGTGKTTVARLIANIYYSLGYIKKNKVVEVQSQDLIGEWLGQTGPKTQAVIDSALDGVLFIDEAYSLMEHKGSSASYTAECIATLLKAMEDYKGRLVVIFAGYTEEMMQFRDLNPGLKSRIGFELTFKDYSIDELVEIFRKKIKDENLELEEEAIRKVRVILEDAKKIENFGNGRFVDNMVQKVIIAHAKRMKNEDDMSVLLKITDEDIIDVKAERSKNKIGF